VISPTTHAEDQRARDAGEALAEACEAPAIRSSWSFVSNLSSRPLPPDVRVAREVASAVIHHAIDEVVSNRRAGTIKGMRLTGASCAAQTDKACRMSASELGILIEFLCSSALEDWIDSFGLHVSARSVRRYLRIDDPAADLAALKAYRESAQLIGPTRTAAALRQASVPQS
jgi:hypothetical protein